MSYGPTKPSSTRTAPISPLAQRAYEQDTPEWLNELSRRQNDSSRETSFTTTANTKSKFFAYESRSTTPEALGLDLDDVQLQSYDDIGYSRFHEKGGNNGSVGSTVPVTNGNASEDGSDEGDVVLGGVGRLPDEVYDRTLNWWRAGIRRSLLKNIEWESKVLATMQVSFVFRSISSPAVRDKAVFIEYDDKSC